MPTLICSMRNGHAHYFADIKIRVPGKPAKLDGLTEVQAKRLRSDVRVKHWDAMPAAKPAKVAEAAPKPKAKPKAAPTTDPKPAA